MTDVHRSKDHSYSASETRDSLEQMIRWQWRDTDHDVQAQRGMGAPEGSIAACWLKWWLTRENMIQSTDPKVQPPHPYKTLGLIPRWR